MKAIDKPTIAERDRLVDVYETATNDLEEAINEYNQTISDAFDKLEEKKNEYNGSVVDLKDWASGVANDIQEFIDDHGEKWQEGERGQAYAEWQSSYENFELEEFECEAPEPLETPDVSADGPFSELSEDIEF